jgi:hypothetical protein
MTAIFTGRPHNRPDILRALQRAEPEIAERLASSMKTIAAFVGRSGDARFSFAGDSVRLSYVCVVFIWTGGAEDL